MSDATTNLLTSWEEQKEDIGDGFHVIRFSASGDPHVTAVLDAVIDNYHSLAARPRPSRELLESHIGLKVTIIEHGGNMFGAPLLVAREGKLFHGTGGGLGILPKGARSKGYRVEPDKVLDVIEGYQTEFAQTLVNDVRSYFPKVKALTQERLEQLPAESGTMLNLCLFGTYRMPDSTATGTLVLAGEYDRELDIVDTAVILIRPEHGVSENGSFYGRDLLHVHKLGEVVGYQPISFKEGIDLCDLDFDAAVASVMSNNVAVA